MKNKNKIISMIIIFTLLALQLTLTSCQQETEQQIETFTVTKGDIVQRVTSTGHVNSSKQKNYSIQSSGEVLLSLEKGDSFSKGDIIFKIDNQRTELNIKNAEENLKLAQSSLGQAKINYQQALDTNHIAVQLAEANKELAAQNTKTASIALDDAYKTANESNDYARAALKSARTSLNTAQITVEGAEQALADSKNILEEAEDDSIYNDTQIAQYESNVNSAENNVENSQANLESVQAQIDSAEATYEQTEAQSSAQVHSAEGAYEQALINQNITNWSTLGETQNAEKQILLAQQGIKQAEFQINIAKINIDLAKLDLDKNKVIAPFNGFVLDANFSEGELASPGVSVVSIIREDFIITSQIDETDIDKIEIGQQVDFTLDAFYGNDYKGKIIDISPISENIGGIVSYEIEVEPENKENLIHGLTANLEIISTKASDVLIVPTNSVYEENGKFFIDLQIDEEIRKKEVKVGESSYDYIEIHSGLKEGDIIITSRLENE